MAEEFENTIKPISLKEEQFEKFAEELLKNWAEYKRLDTRIKMIDASVKKYLLDNKKISYENKYGSLAIVVQQRRVLNRELIDDI